MNSMKKLLLPFLFLAASTANGQNVTVKSPDGAVTVTVANGVKLTYAVGWKNRPVVNSSAMGFEFRDEEAMAGNFSIANQSVQNVNEKWIPVVKSKHSEVV